MTIGNMTTTLSDPATTSPTSTWGRRRLRVVLVVAIALGVVAVTLVLA
jgi:hypothetical protein